MGSTSFVPMVNAPPDPQDEGNSFAYLGKGGKWKTGQVKFEQRTKAVVLTRKLSASRPGDRPRTQRTVSLESLQRITLDAGDDAVPDSVTVSLQSAAAGLTLRALNAPDASRSGHRPLPAPSSRHHQTAAGTIGPRRRLPPWISNAYTQVSKWLQQMLEELVRVRPELAQPRPAVSDESITEKLKLVCESEVPSFSVDLLALLLKEFGVFAKRADLKNHLQKIKCKVETYRDTVDAVKEILSHMDGKEIFDRYATVQQPSGNLMTVIDFHRFVTGSQGQQLTLPQTLRQLRSIATCDSDLLDLLLVSRRVFRSALVSKLYTMPLKPELMELRQPLDLPLTDYFISTSHNTYLMEDQLKGRSDCLAYEIALKKNCRCVELDIHNGPNNDPVITHGGTMTSRIRFEDVIKTIRRFAFAASEYPLILSFENHCSLEQQDRMAQILNNHLKEFLYMDENSETMDRLPCPEDLKRKIIIKNKKSQATDSPVFGTAADTDAEDDDSDVDGDDVDDESDVEIQVVPAVMGGHRGFAESPPTALTAKDKSRRRFSVPAVPLGVSEQQRSDFRSGSPPAEVSILSAARRVICDRTAILGLAHKKRRAKLKVSQSLSDLVSICRPVKYKGKKFARENYRPVEMSSLVEGKMDKKQWLKKDGEDANKLVLHTQFQLVRIYPSGLRTNSSNYNPVIAWRFGCQLVALNYQTRCENMEMNDGLFQLNGACGYVPKPTILTDPATKFNPFSPSQNLARNLRLEVVSGANLRLLGKEKEAEEKGLAPYVKVALFGVPGDEKKDQTKKVDQGFNPRWNYCCFEDNKLVKVPDLAHLRLEVKDKNSGKVIGQFTAPLTAFSKGYRHIFLKDSKDTPTASELWIRFKLLLP